MPTSCKTPLQHSLLQEANWFSGVAIITSVSAHVLTTGEKSLLATTSAVAKITQKFHIVYERQSRKTCPASITGNWEIITAS